MKYTKILLVILIIGLWSGINYAQFKNQLSLPHNPGLLIDTTNNTPNLSEKSPLLAGTLSFIVPGLALGQFYNGQILKGVLHVGISGLGFVLFMSGVNMGGSNKSTAYAGFLIYIGNWIYTTFEAIASAEKINSEIMLQKYQSGILNKFKFGLTPDHNKNLNLKFSISL